MLNLDTRRQRCAVRSFLCAIALAVFAHSPSFAAQEPVTAKPYEEGATVQLQGCVIEAERPGSFVFSGVTAWPVAATPYGAYGPRHFWLSNAADFLAGHVGRTIQVTGTITEVRESEIERDPGYSSHGGRRVAIELPIGDVYTSVELAGVGTGERDSRVDMKITLLKVKIESLLVVLPQCLPSVG